MGKAAEQIAKKIELCDVIVLTGDLGVGKTSFVQYLVASLTDNNIEITSPTFNLLHIYDLYAFPIWHYDLYRLKSINEIYELGIEDALSKAVTIIEWPEIILEILPKNRLELHFELTSNENVRKISWRSSAPKWIESISKVY